MKMTKLFALVGFCVFSSASLGAEDGVEHIAALSTKRAGIPINLNGDDGISTKASFQPPVEISITAKTDSTNLRIGYAADQIIFNWEGGRQQLRVDGGPANGKHKAGAGLIPINKYVVVKWVVTTSGQRIYVDDQLRFEHNGDYSKINSPVTIFGHKSRITVKSIKVKQLPAGSK